MSIRTNPWSRSICRVGILFVILSAIVIPATEAQTHQSELTSTIASAKIELVKSDQHSIKLALDPPSTDDLLKLIKSDASKNGEDSGKASLTTEVGAPQLPVYSTLIAIPPNASYELVIQTDELVYPVNSEDLLPVPRIVQDREDETSFTHKEWVRNQQIYNRPGLYPDSAIKITDDAWLRSQRLLKVEFYPMQVAALDGILYWHPNMRAEVVLTYPESEGWNPNSNFLVSQENDPYTAILDNIVINPENAKDWQGKPEITPLVDDYPIANGQSSLKIVVDHEGIYKISYEDMATAGMDMTGINPLNFHLLNLNQEAAYSLQHDGDLIFETGEKVLFYGEGLPSLRLEAIYQSIMSPMISQCLGVCRIKDIFEDYTLNNVYWLYVGTAPGVISGEVDGTPGQTSVSTYFTNTVHAEQDVEWWSFHFTSADSWFWKRAIPSSRFTVVYTMPITLEGLAQSTGDAFIRGEVVARTASTHVTRFFLNNSLILDSTWSGNVRYPFEATFPATLLQEGENQLRFQVILNGQPQDIYFDWFEISYKHAYTANNGRLPIHQAETGRWQYQVNGLIGSEVHAWNVTDPLNPINVSGVNYNGLGSAVFDVSSLDALELFVAGSDGLEIPKSIDWYEPPDLEPSTGADYIIITHRDFLTATQELANFRNNQGLRTVVVDVEDLYNQYNYGIFHPIAIRNYLENAMLTWPGPMPRYALLVGDSSFEMRSTSDLFVDEEIYMPPHLGVIDPWQGEVDATSMLAAVIGTDILQDLAIGRIPVKTEEEFNIVLGKTIAYEQAPPADWQRRTIYIADKKDPIAGDFLRSSNELASAYTPNGYSAQKFYYCTNPLNHPDCSNATSVELVNSIITELNTNGALFVNYTGHGAPSSWFKEAILDRDDLQQLTNGNMLPVVLSWTCLDGFFDYPFAPSRGSSQWTPSLAEAWLTYAGKGAVATFSPTGLGVATGHDYLAQGFYDTILVNGIWDLGAASLGAKARLYSAGAYDDLMKTFLIFGDPALQIPNPYDISATPLSLSDEQLIGYSINYEVTAENTGPIQDGVVVSVESSQWAVTTPVLNETYGPGGQIVFQVAVHVPADATPQSINTATIKVASKGDRSQYELVTITTTALQPTAWIYLPHIRR